MEAEMKALRPLSASARELLEAGSRVEPPSAEQSERMARTLAPLFQNAGSALPGTSVPAPRGPFGSSRLLLGGSAKLLLAVGALAASNGVSFWLGRVSSPVEPAAAPAAAAAQAASEPPLAASSSTVAQPSEPKAVPAPPAGAPSLPASPPPPAPRASGAPRAAGLRADIQRLARADAELREGKPSDAQRLLARPVVRELREQAAALRAVAGCMLAASSAAGEAKAAAAQREARATLERFPESPYQARIRSACEP
jgi:hypothetical protein